MVNLTKLVQVFYAAENGEERDVQIVDYLIDDV